MELLIFLAGRREQLVSRDEIFDRLWHADVFIDTERNINNLVRKLRSALGDHADKPRFVETVVGKGYRFVGPIRVIEGRYNADHSAERPLRNTATSPARYSKDPVAYGEFVQGFRRSSSGDPRQMEEAAQHLMNAVTRDPEFALAHAVLSYVCAARHFEFDPSRNWLEKAEFHGRRAMELDSTLPEAHVAKAFLLWGPSKNFQHIEAIGELKRALALQKDLPHAYNRMGTIFAHIGSLEQARTMYKMASSLDARQAVSHSISQVYLWGGEYERANEEIAKWRVENPANKYAIYFAPQPLLFTEQFKEAQELLDEASGLMPNEPLIISLQGVLLALTGKSKKALDCMSRACANPNSFGHAHHTYYQIACILSILGRVDSALEWLERTVETGFACWPFFLKDPCLKNLRELSRFELLVNSLQAKYTEELGR